MGSNFITGGNSIDSLVGDGQDQDTVFGGERSDTLNWGDYMEAITLTNKPPVLKKTITVTNNRDSGSGSLRDAVVPSHDESTEYFNGSNGVLTVATNFITGGNGNDSIAPPRDEDMILNFITGDSGNDSISTFRDAVATSTKVTLKNLIIASGTERSQDESNESATQDTLTRQGYSGTSPYFTITPDKGNDVFFATTGDRLIGTLGGNDTISYYEMPEPTTRDSLIIDTLGGNGSSESGGTDTVFGGMDDRLNANNQNLIIQNTNQLFSSGVGSVEITVFLPAVQSAREQAARSTGASLSDGAWTLSTFEASEFRGLASSSDILERIKI